MFESKLYLTKEEIRRAEDEYDLTANPTGEEEGDLKEVSFISDMLSPLYGFLRSLYCLKTYTNKEIMDYYIRG